MKLSTASEKFILHWGEMGARWGVNRSQGQIHALLYLADRPLHAEEIAETLGVARSNVSTSLKELQSWGLVKVTHLMGDRRDHFTGVQDVWEIFLLVLEGRRRREIDPTVGVMRDCAKQAEVENDPALPKVRAMNEFLDLMLDGYEQVKSIPPEALLQLVKMAKQMQGAMQNKGAAGK
jgi:DNA-binding transcriptional regulator GbsR (MarR family)